jgi:hypothetical protein
MRFGPDPIEKTPKRPSSSSKKKPKSVSQIRKQTAMEAKQEYMAKKLAEE